jgi:sugar phosphate isomerase/epimerase
MKSRAENSHSITRRELVAGLVAAPFAFSQAKALPVGLQLFTLRNELEKDLPATLKQVATIGYRYVEFYVPFYFTWTPAFARDVRKNLDDLGLKCTSSHNTMEAFEPAGIGKAIELNQIIGARYVISARRPPVTGIDGWKKIAETLNSGNEKLRAAGLNAGYHTTVLEWKPVDGQRPVDVLFQNTDKSFAHQLDVGTCLATGSDPVVWINRNPGRIRSLHLKDWSPEKEYGVLFGQGSALWNEILATAEGTGGAEFLVIEQETSVEPPIDAVAKDLELYRKLRQGVAR